jgi:hypothetical protein
LAKHLLPDILCFAGRDNVNPALQTITKMSKTTPPRKNLLDVLERMKLKFRPPNSHGKRGKRLKKKEKYEPC